MKKILALVLSVLTVSSVLASCSGERAAEKYSPKITVSSSDAAESAVWLTEKLGDRLTDEVYLAVGDAKGIDMSDFENDGYVIRTDAGNALIVGRSADGLDRGVRKYAKAVQSGTADGLDITYHEGYRVKRLTVCGRDISEYAIVKVADVTEYEPLAAQESMDVAADELQSYIEKTCGARLAIVTDHDAAPAHALRLAIGSVADYGDEAFSIKVTDSGDVVITGGRYRGCMYGVYDFLEEDIGWRFVNDIYGRHSGNNNYQIDYLYESEHVDVTSAADRFEDSSIKYREFYDAADTVYNTPLAKKFKVSFNVPGAYGLTGKACHGLDADHSNIFKNDEYLGERIEGRQPCYTNEDIITAIENYVIWKVESGIAAGQRIGREIVTIDIAQPDNASFCTCDDCRAVFNKEGCNTGAVLMMTNRAAAVLAEAYPGVYVSMLAYHGTDAPPKTVRPLDNVRISYCFYISNGDFYCNTHHIDDENCPGNFKMNRLFKKWTEMSPNVDVWYYPLQWYNVAYSMPLFDSILNDMKYLASQNIGGLMYHGQLGDGSILYPLSLYLGSRLAWDASITEEEYYAYALEWFHIVYGEESGDDVYTYFRMCETANDILDECCCSFHHGLDYAGDHCMVDAKYMADNFDFMYELYHDALDEAESAGQEKRLKSYFSGMMYVCIGITYEDRYTNGSPDERAVMAERYRECYDMFVECNRMVTFEAMEGASPSYFNAEFDLERNPFEYFVPDPFGE